MRRADETKSSENDLNIVGGQKKDVVAGRKSRKEGKHRSSSGT